MMLIKLTYLSFKRLNKLLKTTMETHTSSIKSKNEIDQDACAESYL